MYVILLLVSIALTATGAQAETATELIPGVINYGNHTQSTELIPGVTTYSGRYEGYATEIIPGVRNYELRLNPIERERQEQDRARGYEWEQTAPAPAQRSTPTWPRR